MVAVSCVSLLRRGEGRQVDEQEKVSPGTEPKFGTLSPYHKSSPKREHHYRLWVRAGPGLLHLESPLVGINPAPPPGTETAHFEQQLDKRLKDWIVGLMPVACKRPGSRLRHRGPGAPPEGARDQVRLRGYRPPSRSPDKAQPIS